MTNKDIIIIADYSSSDRLTLADVCEACRVKEELVHVFVMHDVLQPQGSGPAEWQFSMRELQRMQTALRLHRELEVNIEALSLVLNLLDEIDDLRVQAEIVKRHYEP